MPQGYKPYPDPKQDRRRKLTPEQYEEIRSLYDKGNGLSMTEIGRKYGVSRHMVAIIVKPERAEAVKQRIKDHWQKYSNREDLTKAARSLRKRKKELGLAYTIKNDGR
jgi:predicted DNA-binding protein YlxM (UPF0122 family)